MRAVRCLQHGALEDLVVEDLPAPEPGPGEVVVDVVAAALNFPDALIVSNEYQISVPPPFTPGSEFAGVVSSVGEGVTAPRVGDRVMATMIVGAFAEQIAVPAASVRPMPDGLDFDAAAAFGVPVGWSDHTEGLEISLAAIAAGAQVLEKHFTLDRTMPGPDHRASLEPDELSALVRTIREVEGAMGDGVKRPASSELANTAAARRSLHASRDLPQGHVLDEADLVALRPGTGLSPALRGRLIGRRLRVGVERGEMLAERHLD